MQPRLTAGQDQARLRYTPHPSLQGAGHRGASHRDPLLRPLGTQCHPDTPPSTVGTPNPTSGSVLGSCHLRSESQPCGRKQREPRSHRSGTPGHRACSVDRNLQQLHHRQASLPLPQAPPRRGSHKPKKQNFGGKGASSKPSTLGSRKVSDKRQGVPSTGLWAPTQLCHTRAAGCHEPRACHSHLLLGETVLPAAAEAGEAASITPTLRDAPHGHRRDEHVQELPLPSCHPQNKL